MSFTFKHLSNEKLTSYAYKWDCIDKKKRKRKRETNNKDSPVTENNNKQKNFYVFCCFFGYFYIEVVKTYNWNCSEGLFNMYESV